MKNYNKLSLLLLLAIGNSVNAGWADDIRNWLASGTGLEKTPLNTTEAQDLSKAMRKLWADHVIWTRDYVISAIANAEDKAVATERLLKNQRDIGDAVAGFYGKEAGDKLAELLKEHILIAAALIEAAKVNDSAKVKDEDAKWHKNAEDIAVFLSSANPNNWDKADLQAMLNDHLRLTTDEVLARLKHEWKKDADSFDAIFAQALGMADMFTLGIVNQFPNKF